jgi:hypothetical protein
MVGSKGRIVRAGWGLCDFLLIDLHINFVGFSCYDVGDSEACHPLDHDIFYGARTSNS